MRLGDPAGGAEVRLRDGTRVTLRPIRPDDEPLMVRFHQQLSARSVYQRYFHLASVEQRIAHARLALTCHVDRSAGLAIVAEHTSGDGTPEILGLGRATRTDPPGSAEIALLIVDRWHGLGLGTAIMQRLVSEARDLGIQRLYGDMLADNDAMRAVVRHAGFVIRTVPGDAVVLRAERSLV